jgi:hypothetical protein
MMKQVEMCEAKKLKDTAGARQKKVWNEERSRQVKIGKGIEGTINHAARYIDWP